MLYSEIIKKYPNPDKDTIDALLDREIEKSGMKFVVLDDDPTGVQTVHGVSVFTDWSEESILEGFEENNNVFYILTNSRGLTAAQTAPLHELIAGRVTEAVRKTGKTFCVISRSDSTLRGHYPLETQILKEGYEKAGLQLDGEILVPYFKEGGRFTIDNVHYVKTGDELVPAAETEFAKDVTFGYTHSDLPGYIEEKTAGAFRAEDVTCISLDDLRSVNINRIEQQLMSVRNFGKVAVNCLDDCDMKIFCIALYRAMENGKRFMFRTAAGFVRAVAGIRPKPLLTGDQMLAPKDKEENCSLPKTGGIVVVGSHTAKTTAQLKRLLQEDYAVPVALDCNKLLDSDEAFEEEVSRCLCEEQRILQEGKTAVCYTDRTLIIREDETKEEALLRSVKISDGVQRLVGELEMTPAFVVAKGGITSADVGTKALRVRKAKVLGQIAPGVPVWQTGEESLFPGIPFVIFPGNVGDDMTLTEAVRRLCS